MMMRIFMYDYNKSNQMGSICNPTIDVGNTKEGVLKKESIHIQANNNNQPNAMLDFAFTTQKVIHLNSDLLIIFIDQSINLRKNDHFIKLPLQAAKLEQFAHAKLQRLKNGSGVNVQAKIQYVTFSIMIPTLNHKNVSLIFCNIWEDTMDFKLQFSKQLGNYFESIKDMELSSIIITQFTEELGIPLQKGMNIAVKQMMKLKKKPKNVQFCCLSQDSKNLLSKLIEQNKEALQKSFIQGDQRNSYF